MPATTGNLVLGCIADDYTGASDLANTLTKAGLRTIQTIGMPPEDLALPEVDAVVFALKSRSIPAPEAIAKSREADRWLRRRGAPHVMFKICSTFDSTADGNIGPVMEALRADAGDRIVVVTPAFPETGRTIYQGNLFVAGLPLNESPMKDHPLNPMRDANLMRVLAAQGGGKIGLVDLATVVKGADAIRARLDDLAAEDHNAAIVDTMFDSDLAAIGEASLSGLGLGLAQALMRSGHAEAARHAGDLGAPVGGFAACLAGSCSRATLGQIAAADKVMPVRHLDIEALVDDEPGEIGRTLAWAKDHMRRGPVLIASSAEPKRVAALQKSHGRAFISHAIEGTLARIAHALVDAGVRRLVVAGGETSGAVVDDLRVPAFLIGPEIAPGVPVLRGLGGKAGDMMFALKSGNFGGPNFFADALALMR
jgi:uncharacterized protein YgbK (DUF1537 family)